MSDFTPINFTPCMTDPFATTAACLALPVWQEQPLPALTQEADVRLSGAVSQVITGEGFEAAVGDTRVLYFPADQSSPRWLVWGLGKPVDAGLQTLRVAAARLARAVRGLKQTSLALPVPELPGVSAALCLEAVVEGIHLGLHSSNEFKTDDRSRNPVLLQQVWLVGAEQDGFAETVQRAEERASARILVRQWVNLPSNRKSPQFLADQAQRLAAENGLRCEVWDEQRIAGERMEALQGVGQGSALPPRFIILEHCPPGTQEQAPILLVGKGMTFDSGGLSLKSATNMVDMKDDMAGAAIVISVMQILARRGYPHRVIGLVPTAENMVSGQAQRPGDIVTSRNGKTIEILNTDAEGRLILADALSYGSELKPRLIVDFATLTGAMKIALGTEAAGVFCNDADLEARVIAAGQRSGDRVWPFPMWPEYKSYVKGTISDLKNIGPERTAGSICGAVFLQHFVGEGIPWAHVDIAAVANIHEDKGVHQPGATGFGTGLALSLLEALDTAS